MSDHSIQISTRAGGQAASLFKQRPAQPVECGIGLLLGPAHFIHGGGGMRDNVDFIESDAGVWTVLGDALDKGGRHIDAGRVDLAGIAFMSRRVDKCPAKDSTLGASLPSAT